MYAASARGWIQRRTRPQKQHRRNRRASNRESLGLTDPSTPSPSITAMQHNAKGAAERIAPGRLQDGSACSCRTSSTHVEGALPTRETLPRSAFGPPVWQCSLQGRTAHVAGPASVYAVVATALTANPACYGDVTCGIATQVRHRSLGHVSPTP